ncbi:MAG: 1-acyl-sn-glycerol-3-phosphate acyltransferase [Dysgonamonadaceae bacterium]|jgi:1-acyl-sn-glycerol-3-phosphate acyltransferase|nr:1-acyl-sn-glycerol-3-phosphate acyltransferase [Dysgonamonadaceae bacterium]
MSVVCAFLLRLLGWKSSLSVPIPQKCVICVAPHTSNWDFIIGMLFYKSIKGSPYFLMKESWFFFPLNYILKSLGGIPVNRSQQTSLTEQLAERFRQRDTFQLAITPEGTRKKNPKWKTGFYYIAYEVGVPISIAYLNYSEKIIGVFENLIPTGDVEKDIAYIKTLYRNIPAKHPKQFAFRHG